MGVKVKDKIYYLAEWLGIPKCWVSQMLDVSDTTLTKWSYNPLNVSQEMSERIFLRLAILETLGVSFKEITAYLSDTETGAPTPKKFVLVTIGGNVYYVRDVRRRLPSDPPKALVPLVRNALIREENQHPLYIRHRYGPDRRNGVLSKIACDETLEMPRGVFKWDKERI